MINRGRRVLAAPWRRAEGADCTRPGTLRLGELTVQIEFCRLDVELARLERDELSERIQLRRGRLLLAEISLQRDVKARGIVARFRVAGPRFRATFIDATVDIDDEVVGHVAPSVEPLHTLQQAAHLLGTGYGPVVVHPVVVDDDPPYDLWRPLVAGRMSVPLLARDDRERSNIVGRRSSPRRAREQLAHARPNCLEANSS